jgi:hypothetical protein
MEAEIIVKVMPEIRLEEVKIGQEIKTKSEPNVTLYYEDTRTVTITTGEKWYTRFWYLISNPFRYLFTGNWKF